MNRIIDHYLLEWKNRPNRKSLLLRGARQVGKTHAIRELGKTFSRFVEINLESNPEAKSIFEKNMDPHKIVQLLSELLQTTITPGKTLLFIDEIQNVPDAITSLRYFYEMMPELHVVGAGSLLDFAIENVGVPVGRVTFLHLYPLSFFEFLVATGNAGWAQLLLEKNSTHPMSDGVHEKILAVLGEYLAIGGMPEAVQAWITKKQSRSAKLVHADLLAAYTQDFEKYAKQHQQKYLTLLFEKATEQLSKKFMFSRVGEYKKRELEPALELLEKAGLFYRVFHSSGQGVPIGAQADLHDFKIIFLDSGLNQALQGLDLVQWFLNPRQAFINKGEIVEAFIGQEIVAYSDPISKKSLYYWHREKTGSQAEVDYLVQIKSEVVPIEVKAGTSKRIKSMQIFFDSHANSSYGIRFSADNYAEYEKIHSYPLYAVIKPFFDASETVQEALAHLLKTA